MTVKSDWFVFLDCVWAIPWPEVLSFKNIYNMADREDLRHKKCKTSSFVYAYLFQLIQLAQVI